MPTEPVVALSIAGSDSSGGAGVQADLKTFVDHQIHGTSAITAVTAQNTMGVRAIAPVPPKVIRAQIEAVFDEFEIRAVKIGMLGDVEAVRAVVQALKGRSIPIVVDPVLKATSGASLSNQDAIQALACELIPLATLVTPNNSEWVRLEPHVGHNTPVLITGGDEEGEMVVDRLIRNGGTTAFRRPRIHADAPFHGTGCTLSTAVAARLAYGESLADAIEGANRYVRRRLAQAWRVGAGQYLLPHGMHS